MNEFVFQSRAEADTDRLGAALAELLPAGTTIALNGTLGAGKTRLTQALASAYGIHADDVTSPTFVLCQHYPGRRTIHHLDAYRIQDDDEFLELGVDEYFESDGITIVEWADRVPRCLPRQHIEIEITVSGESVRTIHVRGHGAPCGKVVDALAQRLG